MPRAFYGKYKYFKIYNENDAKYFDKLEKIYHFRQKDIYFHELLIGEKYIYLFTNNCLYIFDNINNKIIHDLEYVSINNVICGNEKVTAYLNEEGKKKYKRNEILIICENNDISQNIINILNNKYKNKN